MQLNWDGQIAVGGTRYVALYCVTDCGVSLVAGALWSSALDMKTQSTSG